MHTPSFRHGNSLGYVEYHTIVGNLYNGPFQIVGVLCIEFSGFPNLEINYNILCFVSILVCWCSDDIVYIPFTGGNKGCIQQDLCHHLHQLQEHLPHLDTGKILKTISKL